MPRLFTGLEIPAAVGEALSRHRGGVPGARWVEPADYHITLRYVGDVDGGLAEEIAGALAETRPRGALALALDGLASFGGDRPHAIYARVVPSAPLDELQAEQERLMRRLGLKPETRRFTPHVTLARLRREASAEAVAQYLALQGGTPPLAFTATRFVLYSARDSVGGGPYLVEAAYALEP
ncbi:RNA 2',3'-cyclic phosphodiesterase [Methylobacterium sp. JK268]